MFTITFIAEIIQPSPLGTINGTQCSKKNFKISKNCTIKRQNYGKIKTQILSDRER